jgi:hypothetical protein
VKGVLSGYCAAEEHQRYARQLQLLDLPRTFLSLPVRGHRRSTGADGYVFVGRPLMSAINDGSKPHKTKSHPLDMILLIWLLTVAARSAAILVSIKQ